MYTFFNVIIMSFIFSLLFAYGSIVFYNKFFIQHGKLYGTFIFS